MKERHDHFHRPIKFSALMVINDRQISGPRCVLGILTNKIFNLFIMLTVLQCVVLNDIANL